MLTVSLFSLRIWLFLMRTLLFLMLSAAPPAPSFRSPALPYPLLCQAREKASYRGSPMYRVSFCSKLLGKSHSSGEVPFIIGSSSAVSYWGSPVYIVSLCSKLLEKSHLWAVFCNKLLGKSHYISGVFFCRLKINLDAHARARILHGPDVGVVYASGTRLHDPPVAGVPKKGPCARRTMQRNLGSD